MTEHKGGTLVDPNDLLLTREGFVELEGVLASQERTFPPCM